MKFRFTNCCVVVVVFKRSLPRIVAAPVDLLFSQFKCERENMLFLIIKFLPRCGNQQSIMASSFEISEIQFVVTTKGRAKLDSLNVCSIAGTTMMTSAPTTAASMLPSDAIVIDGSFLRTLNMSAGGEINVRDDFNVAVFPNAALSISNGVFGIAPDSALDATQSILFTFSHNVTLFALELRGGVGRLYLDLKRSVDAMPLAPINVETNRYFVVGTPVVINELTLRGAPADTRSAISIRQIVVVEAADGTPLPRTTDVVAPSMSTTTSLLSGDDASGLPIWAYAVIGGVGGLLLLVCIIVAVVVVVVRRSSSSADSYDSRLSTQRQSIAMTPTPQRTTSLRK